MQNEITKIQKREGNVVAFDHDKITTAILKAGQVLKEFDKAQAEMLSDKAVEMLNTLYGTRKSPPRVEEIQDVVEIILMKNGFVKSAKAYIIYRGEHKKIRKAKQELLSGKTTKLPLSINAIRVIANRYLRKNLKTQKVLETPEGMFERIAKALAHVEKKYKVSAQKIRQLQKQFYEVMANFEFMPAGRTLANAGTDHPIVSNCIVLHIDDSMDGIFQTLHDAALLQQAGSGLGFPFHMLRPAGSIGKRTQSVASGPVSFLKVYNRAFGVIKQQMRSGANMSVMRVDHPDVLDFIHCKEKEGEIVNFNISVAVTDTFMRAVEKNSKDLWMCEWNGKKMLPRRVKKDRNGIVQEIKEEKLTAREIVDEIVHAAWSNGEPGIIFIDEVNRTNPLPGLGRLEASNPCAEQMLHAWDVCNLGSINLDKFVTNKKINWKRLKEVTEIGTRMLDNVIDITEFPVDRVNNVFRKNRRIGLGVMGFADMLFQLRIPYNSERGRETAEKVMKFINDKAHKTSIQLAKGKGVFPNYNLSIFKKKGIKLRNAALTTVAPTGSISMVVDACSGLEPCFALAYVKEVMSGQKLYYTNRHLETALRECGLYSEKLIQEIAQKGSIQSFKQIPVSLRKVFVGSLDISVTDHIKMQAAFQKHVDNSISKTINFPNDAPPSDVLDAYMLAWKLRCKSCTVYREGSRQSEVLTLASKKEHETSSPALDMLEHPTNKCPECGGKLWAQEGCLSCPQCGFGLCSI
ncbi:adenosylcobalamin-dependent ribonucleoside-diphosphate reductase [Patescibacteria group bacterium AH-259-L05]|nr:adenosylcobalamin-dependent ribonucleoside-diphosphate reductase [Patescibacteria group bacterium AH-259-L05]